MDRASGYIKKIYYIILAKHFVQECSVSDEEFFDVIRNKQ